MRHTVGRCSLSGSCSFGEQATDAGTDVTFGARVWVPAGRQISAAAMFVDTAGTFTAGINRIGVYTDAVC